jgi:hypothetical protein
MASLADLEFAYLGSLGAAGTLNDRRRAIYGANQHAYFGALSGLTPTRLYSLNDHKLAYYRTQSGLAIGSLADCQREFWAP